MNKVGELKAKTKNCNTYEIQRVCVRCVKCLLSQCITYSISSFPQNNPIGHMYYYYPHFTNRHTVA